MKQEQIFWFEEVCLKLKVSRTELYDFWMDAGFVIIKMVLTGRLLIKDLLSH